MTPTVLMAWAGVVIIGLIGAALVFLIVRGKIDLTCLLAESNDTQCRASLAKLQFLIFTFVIAFCLFALTIRLDKFPFVDPNVLVLLGISAGSSLASSGIAAAERTRLAELRADVRKAQPSAIVSDL